MLTHRPLASLPVFSSIETPFCARTVGPRCQEQTGCSVSKSCASFPACAWETPDSVAAVGGFYSKYGSGTNDRVRIPSLTVVGNNPKCMDEEEADWIRCNRHTWSANRVLDPRHSGNIIRSSVGAGLNACLQDPKCGLSHKSCHSAFSEPYPNDSCDPWPPNDEANKCAKWGGGYEACYDDPSRWCAYESMLPAQYQCPTPVEGVPDGRVAYCADPKSPNVGEVCSDIRTVNFLNTDECCQYFTTGDQAARTAAVLPSAPAKGQKMPPTTTMGNSVQGCPGYINQGAVCQCVPRAVGWRRPLSHTWDRDTIKKYGPTKTPTATQPANQRTTFIRQYRFDGSNRVVDSETACNIPL